MCNATLTTKPAKNSRNSIFPMAAAADAAIPKPKIAAIIAITRNRKAQ